ncbi:hypothetical protein TNCV_3744831 [Trichonephila clavipes]|nr:hypothetical protein TNCV_3744831 [Trichonephila clavipes]
MKRSLGLHRLQAKGKSFWQKYVAVNESHPLVLRYFWSSLSGFLNRPFDVFSHSTSLGLNSFACFASMMARLKLTNHVFFDANGLYKTGQNPVLRWAPADIPARTWHAEQLYIPMHRVYRGVTPQR